MTSENLAGIQPLGEWSPEPQVILRIDLHSARHVDLVEEHAEFDGTELIVGEAPKMLASQRENGDDGMDGFAHRRFEGFGVEDREACRQLRGVMGAVLRAPAAPGRCAGASRESIPLPRRRARPFPSWILATDGPKRSTTWRRARQRLSSRPFRRWKRRVVRGVWHRPCRPRPA